MILRGWKEICAELGGISINAVRRLAHDEGLPVTMLCGKPSTTKDALKAWLENRVKKKVDTLERTSLPPERTSALSPK